MKTENKREVGRYYAKEHPLGGWIVVGPVGFPLSDIKPNSEIETIIFKDQENASKCAASINTTI